MMLPFPGLNASADTCALRDYYELMHLEVHLSTAEVGNIARHLRRAAYNKNTFLKKMTCDNRMLKLMVSLIKISSVEETLQLMTLKNLKLLVLLSQQV